MKSVSKYNVRAAAVNMRGRPCIEARDARLTPVLAVHPYYLLMVTKPSPPNPRHINIYPYNFNKNGTLPTPGASKGQDRATNEVAIREPVTTSLANLLFHLWFEFAHLLHLVYIYFLILSHDTYPISVPVGRIIDQKSHSPANSL